MIKANRRNFLFEEVKQTAPERNGFDLSHENKQTCRANKLYPFEIIELVPNDDVEVQVEQFIRLNPMLSPTMHRLKAYWHWIFTPCRLTWTHFEEFISRGNGKKLDPNQEYTPPEPPSISLLTLLKYSPSDRYIIKSGATPSYFYTGDYQDGVDYLVARHPEIHTVKVADGYTFEGQTYNGLYAVCYRTPRIANALGIPDICFPNAIIMRNTSDGRMWLAPFDYDQISLVMDSDVADYYTNTKISLMPFTATFISWLDYYRDENLDDDYEDLKNFVTNIDGEWIPQNATEETYLKTLLTLHYRCWEKDYFTTATQLPQKAPDVLIPGTGSTLHTSGSVNGDVESVISGSGSVLSAPNSVFGPTQGNQTPQFVDQGNGTFKLRSENDISGVTFDVGHNHGVDASDIANKLTVTSTLKNASVTVEGQSTQLQPTTVAQVRRAFALQRWFEKVVRTGTRYIESLKAFFNSDAGDARLQRPEYVGGSSSPIQISDVVQTSATDETSDTPQGNLAGYGIASETSDFIRYHAPEHGFLIGFFSILARTSYSQGIPRLFSRETWLDYLWPEFEHIGEQAIKQKELAFLPLTNRARKKSDFHAFSSSALPEHIFGYQSRYAEYKQMPDRFGSGFGSTLDFWSLGRIFDATPTLSKEFVHSHVSDRNFAVMGLDAEGSLQNPITDVTSDQMDESYDYDTYICDFWVDCKKVTSLTLYSEPI